jgi:hypothetical protein
VIEINVKCVFKILHKIFNPNFSLQFFSSYRRFYQSTEFPLYIFFLHGSIHCTEYASALITDFSNKRNYVDARIFTFVTYGSSAKIYNLCVPLFFTPTDFLLPLSSASVGRKNTVSSFGLIKQWTR